MGRVDC